MLKRRTRGHIMMPKTVTLTQLEQVLRQLGFCKHVIPTSHIAFTHATGALLLLPLLAEGECVPFVNLAVARSTADDWDIADRETFERMLSESINPRTPAEPELAEAAA